LLTDLGSGYSVHLSLGLCVVLEIVRFAAAAGIFDETKFC